MALMESFGFGGGIRRRNSLLGKLASMHWGMILFITAIACVGFASQYSVAEGGNWDPYASQQVMRFLFGLAVLILVGLIDIRIWYQLAYPAYGLALGLLLLVPVMGEVNMGAQRWIDLGFVALQPSEVMKIALVLALARFFHSLPLHQVSHPLYMLIPLALMGIPAGLVVLQPDLGTTVLLMAGGAIMLFAAGLKWRYILGAMGMMIIAIPVVWQFLHVYQKKRILTFMDPESDKLGAGWHIVQSKIALGSGGVYGKGFLQGKQSYLNYLPEKQTDFIFTVWAEQFGLLGAGGLLLLYLVLLAIGMSIAFQCRNHFGRLLTMGVCATFFLYVFINVAMVMGMIPVVGVPLPFVSYGGTSMMALMFGFGLVMSAHIHRHMELPRAGAAMW